ncbi:hypothetical protein CK220_09115 [Mesorhizobium sp. WSM3860]|nr:hypothetical protein CK220_09115 [Mesorhizobium sp. WSM3860]
MLAGTNRQGRGWDRWSPTTKQQIPRLPVRAIDAKFAHLFANSEGKAAILTSGICVGLILVRTGKQSRTPLILVTYKQVRLPVRSQ